MRRDEPVRPVEASPSLLTPEDSRRVADKIIEKLDGMDLSMHPYTNLGHLIRETIQP